MRIVRRANHLQRTCQARGCTATATYADHADWLLCADHAAGLTAWPITRHVWESDPAWPRGEVCITEAADAPVRPGPDTPTPDAPPVVNLTIH